MPTLPETSRSIPNSSSIGRKAIGRTRSGCKEATARRILIAIREAINAGRAARAASTGMSVTPTELWPWLALAGLGAFHGLNPAMGWLFAVALGLHRGSRRMVLAALPPIALGHALSIGLVALPVMALCVAIDPGIFRAAPAVMLLGWAVC